MSETAQSIVEATDPGQTEFAHERRSYWDGFARNFSRWEGPRRYYQKRLAEIFRFVVPPGMRVLELGCGRGDLLAALRPARGVGIDFSPATVSLGRERYPELEFVEGDVHSLDLNEKFDFIICSDLVNLLWDVQQVFEVASRHSHSSTRLLINSHSRLWEIPRRFAEILGLASSQPAPNWLTVDDIHHLLSLTEFEVIRSSSEIMWPVRTPIIDRIA